MSEIFNSEVDLNLRSELDARATAGRWYTKPDNIRTDSDIQYMVEKIANVTMIPYRTPNTKTRDEIKKGILGGARVRNKDYKPIGMLDPQNSREYRTPPVITSVEIAIGDHSSGLLNTATVKLHIPFPEKDLDLIEAVYFRPGRSVDIIIEHPDSAIAGDVDSLSNMTTTSLQLIESKIPVLARDSSFNEKYRKLNKVTFEGLITSFDFSYNTDLSVDATLSMRGTSNVYTELSLIINNAAVTKKTDPEKPASTQPVKNVDTFYQYLSNQFNELMAKENEKIKTLLKDPKVEAPQMAGVIKYPNPVQGGNTAYGIYGSPYESYGLHRYITLSWLVEYVNETIMSKLSKGTPPSIPSAYIVFNSDVTKSRYFDPKLFVSADPYVMFYPDKPNRTYTRKGAEPVVWYGKAKLMGTTLDAIKFSNGDSYSTPSILINLDTIKKIYDDLIKSDTFTVNALLAEVSDIVRWHSGNAISLKLITHPENQKCLLWYDENYIKTPGPAPYIVPMRANNAKGSLVRDFSLSAKLPDSAASLGYALNQDLSSMEESKIAPFLAFMYAYNSNPEFKEIEPEFGAAISRVNSGTIEADHAKKHAAVVEALQNSINMFAGDVTNTTKISELYTALAAFVKYPIPSLKQNATLAAPVFPFAAEFTIDGINGFKYGDNLYFELLPTRYVTQTIFIVVNVTHTVSTDGIWTTTIRSAMKPKF